MQSEGRGADPALELLDLARSATTAYRRPDLGERLGRTRGAAAAAGARVLVVGGFKAGKTELVNALLGARLLPSDDHAATVVPAVVARAGAPAAALVRPPTGERSGDRVAVAPPDLAAHVTERGNPRNEAGWSHVEVGLPRGLLDAGLVLVDTPGAGGLSSPTGMGTVAELPGADAVVLVSDAARELTAPELQLLRVAAGVCPVVLVALSRVDLHPDWRRVRELDRGHLRAAGLEIDVLPVSAALRLHAVDADDPGLDAESGLPELTDVLVRQVADRGRSRRDRVVADEVLAVCEQLAHGFRVEIDALDPAGTPAGRELAAARQRASALRDRAARWQQTLADGVADLVADVDHDLRERMRGVVTEAEEALLATDPAKTWDQFSTWLQTRVASAATTNFLWAEERTRWLAERVAAHFAEDGAGVLPSVDLQDVAVDPVDLLAAPEQEKLGVGQALLIGMRGSYGGVLMIGMLTTLGGLALINPFSVGAGLLLGGKTLVDERKRALGRRRAEAKAAVRRHVDDVVFRVGKNSRDMLREVHRTLRDHYTRTAEELSASLDASLAAASSVAELGSGDRERRRADLQAELERVEAVAARARALRAATASPPALPAGRSTPAGLSPRPRVPPGPRPPAPPAPPGTGVAAGTSPPGPPRPPAPRPPAPRPPAPVPPLRAPAVVPPPRPHGAGGRHSSGEGSPGPGRQGRPGPGQPRR